MPWATSATTCSPARAASASEPTSTRCPPATSSARRRGRTTPSAIPVPSGSRSWSSWRPSRRERTIARRGSVRALRSSVALRLGQTGGTLEVHEDSSSMLIPATQLRVGMTVEHQNDLWRVMNVVHVTPGNWRGMVQTKLRNLRSGTQTENRFRSEDKVERVTLEQHEMEFLYESDGQYHFMNTETYDQIALDTELLGNAVSYLRPNACIQVELHDGTPMGVSLPKTVDLKVVETAPGLKSATVTNVLKPAKTETGLVVQVPNFIGEGDVIRVDTESGGYLSRAKGE